MTPGSLPEPVAVAVKVARHLDASGVAYVIGGSFASSLHGEPRSTNDIDLVADLDPQSAGAFADALGPEFYVDRTVAIGAAEVGGSFNIVHIETAVKVDVFVGGTDPLDRARLDRRQLAAVGSAENRALLFVDTPEDVVLRKLEWYRRGGESSERQWRDVVGVLSVHDRLDDAYLDAWARRLGVADLLERARTAAR